MQKSRGQRRSMRMPDERRGVTVSTLRIRRVLRRAYVSVMSRVSSRHLLAVGLKAAGTALLAAKDGHLTCGAHESSWSKRIIRQLMLELLHRAFDGCSTRYKIMASKDH